MTLMIAASFELPGYRERRNNYECKQNFAPGKVWVKRKLWAVYGKRKRRAFLTLRFFVNCCY